VGRASHWATLITLDCRTAPDRNFIYLWLYSPCEPWPLCLFLNPYTVGRTPWTGDQAVAKPLPTHRTTQTQAAMLRVGFEPTIPVFERVNKVHALDCVATVIGRWKLK
jgi:hypothetical protein